MVRIKEKHDLALLIKVGEYPTLKVDLDNDLNLENGYHTNSKINCLYEDRGELFETKTKLVKLDNKWYLRNCDDVLSSEFNIDDFLDIAETGTLRTVKDLDIVLVCFYSKKKNEFYGILMQMGVIHPYTSIVTELTPLSIRSCGTILERLEKEIDRRD